MDVITTTLKQPYFPQIVARTKRVEYREIKPSWTRRFKRVLAQGDEPTRPGGHGSHRPNHAETGLRTALRDPCAQNGTRLAR